MVESVHAYTEFKGKSSTFLQWESSCASINVPFSSSPGIV